MPKRMLDDSLLTSPSLAQLSPRAQDAFPRFVLLADDFGCFEVVPKVLHAKGWPYRHDVTDIEVASWLGEYEAAGMLFAWEEGGRMFAYLTGWHGEHGQKARDEYDSKTARHGSKRRTPRPPGFVPADSRFVPERESAGIASLRIPNPFTPARETGFSRQVPATVVPVPVPVPVAGPFLSDALRAPVDADAIAALAGPPPTAASLFPVAPVADEAPAPAPEAAETTPPKAKRSAASKSEASPEAKEKRATWERLFLEARGEPYRWAGAPDQLAANALAPVALSIFEAKAVKGLNGSGFTRCSSLAQLKSKWNDLAGVTPAPGGVKTPVTAPASPQTKHVGGRLAL